MFSRSLVIRTRREYRCAVSKAETVCVLPISNEPLSTCYLKAWACNFVSMRVRHIVTTKGYMLLCEPHGVVVKVPSLAWPPASSISPVRSPLQLVVLFCRLRSPPLKSSAGAASKSGYAVCVLLYTGSRPLISFLELESALLRGEMNLVFIKKLFLSFHTSFYAFRYNNIICYFYGHKYRIAFHFGIQV